MIVYNDNIIYDCI